MTTQRTERKKGIKITRQQFLEKVSTVATSELIPDHAIARRRAQAILTTHQGTSRIVHFATKGYHLLPNEEILDLVESRLKGAFGKLEIEYRKDGEAKYYVDFIVKSQQVEISKGDYVNPRIRVQNSYDGTLKFGFTSGAYRLVCSNGLTVGNLQAKLKYMHTSGLSDTIMDTVVEKLDLFVSSFQEYTSAYADLAASKVKDLAGRVEAVLEDIKFPKKQVAAVIEQAQLECKELGVPMNDWIVYNAFNFQLCHNEAIKLAEHKKVKLDEQILNFLINE